jgi:hypothetical protein
VSLNSHKPTPGSAAAFLAAGSDLGRDRSPILKLTKNGVWVAGVNNSPVTETCFVAEVHEAEQGFVCFVDRKVVDELMTPVALGEKISKDKLPYHGPYKEGDGWRPSASIRLLSLITGEKVLFSTTSVGGRSAIGDLLSKYGRRVAAGEGGMPVIELAVEKYTHRMHGIIHNPVFHIVRWENDTGKEGQAGDAQSLAEELRDDDIPF